MRWSKLLWLEAEKILAGNIAEVTNTISPIGLVDNTVSGDTLVEWLSSQMSSSKLHALRSVRSPDLLEPTLRSCSRRGAQVVGVSAGRHRAQVLRLNLKENLSSYSVLHNDIIVPENCCLFVP